MNRPFKEMMEEWHTTCRFPHNPKLWLKLINEEHRELREAILDKAMVQGENGEYPGSVNWENRIGDHPVLDALGDLLVVVSGMIINMGYDPEQVLQRIHESNMSKFCYTWDDAQASIAKYKAQGIDTQVQTPYFVGGPFTIIRIPDGKVLKGIHYKEPDFSDLTHKL